MLMAHAIQKRRDELGWSYHQHDVTSRHKYEEIMEKFHPFRDDSTVEYEEIDLSDKNLDEMRRVSLELNLGDRQRFNLLWASNKFGIKAKLKSFIEDSNSLWHPAQADGVFVGGDDAILGVLDHEEKIRIWNMA